MTHHHTIRTLTLALAALCLLSNCACQNDPLPEEEGPQPVAPVEAQDAYRDKIRTQPYPKANNELMMNPAPLIVPQAMKTGECLQFNLSRTEDFGDAEAILSEPQAWCMYNVHHRLEEGVWYWRFRSVKADGTEPGAWSDTYHFEVKAGLPVFVTPDFNTFLENAPRTYPRLYCFLNPRIDQARRNVTSHPEYRQLTARASIALADDYTTGNLVSRSEELRQHATWLYHAYMLTRQSVYSLKLKELLTALTATPPADSELFADNFTSSAIALCHAAAYDLLYDELTPAERTVAEEQMMRVLRYYYPQNLGYQENHIFDNHFWQQNLRIYFQCAFLLYNNPAYSDEVLPMLEYYYELWTARAPAGGFNRDGMWHNGTGYFPANVKTLAYMPALLSYVARYDFLQHPWYRNCGQALVYSFPPRSASNGFGDMSEGASEPNRLTAAFADYLARETGDGYAGWYAAECSDLVQTDYELRLYRMCADRDYDSALPAEAPHLVWYKDAGEVAMHSRPGDTEHDLALSFRSSTFGSGSHTTASQNAFNLLYGGENVYRSSGYYQNFSDAHNLMSYRHTRAHNTILVNGIGQPYSTKGYGNVTRALTGNHISYCLGDASHAYCGVTDDPLWVSAFEAAGIEQTSENGFGETPLTKYRRHVLMLHPSIVLIYDELEASEPVRWDWLLHSPVQFNINEGECTLSTATDGYYAMTNLYVNGDIILTQTDQFTVPPAISGPEYPNQWHLTAGVGGVAATRYLAVIQVGPIGEGNPFAIRREGDTFTIGDWTIEAVLDVAEPARLQVTHATDPVVFSYGDDNPVLGDSTYMRRYAASSILYDETDGTYQVQEVTDREAISTRNVK